MPGYHVHAACASYPLGNGGLGAMLVVSTPRHDLNLYEVYTSHGPWTTLLPQFHVWSYWGTLEQCFGRVDWRPRRRTIQRLLGPCAEFFFFANYAGCVTAYKRFTHRRPHDRYAVYALVDVVEPKYFYLARRVQFQGLCTMPGWN